MGSRYCRTLHSIDVNVGRLLDYVDSLGKDVVDDTMIIYTSDQGFFLGDHGWWVPRFMSCPVLLACANDCKVRQALHI